MNKKVKVYNLIILDESGSMSSLHKPAVDGLNETLQSIQSAQATHADLQEHFVSMVFFNSNGIRPIMEDTPVANVKELKQQDFRPNACTPLYDAMGNSLSKLRYRLNSDEQQQVLVTVITDGYENASHEYNGKMIKNLITDLKALGWVFTYIGANQDVEAVAESMAINNRMSFEADNEGYGAMRSKEGYSRQLFYQKLSRKMMDEDVDLHANFFVDEEEEGTPEPKESLGDKFKKLWNKLT